MLELLVVGSCVLVVGSCVVLLVEVAGGRVLVVVPGREDTGLDVLVLNVLVLVVLVLILVGRVVVLVRRVVLGLAGGGLLPPLPSPFCVGVVS